MNSKPDYYAILGANENASRREIDRLYKRAAHTRHPDRGGVEEDMKALNEAYRVLRDETSRQQYDSQRRRPAKASAPVRAAPSAREVGWYGQILSSMLCLSLGLMLLLLVRFNGLWFLWPLSILATGVVLFGVMMAHSAMTNARESLAPSHPARRLRWLQEVLFWSIVCGAGFGLYLVMTTL